MSNSDARRARASRRGGFTLIELLISISIIVLLIALLLPSLEGARRAAKRITCLPNVRALASQSILFEIDNGLLPQGIDGYQTGDPVLSRYTHWDAYNRPYDYNYVWSGHGYAGSYWSDNGQPDEGVGGDFARRFYNVGALIVLGYLSDPDLAYCTDQTTRAAGERQMNVGERGLDRWNGLTETFRSGRDSGPTHEIGYSHFIWKQTRGDWTIDEGDEFEFFSPEFPFSGYKDAEMTTNLMAARYRDYGYSPLLYACATDAVTKAHDMQGVNASMFDGSSRWISMTEIARIKEGGRSSDGGPIHPATRSSDNPRLLWNTDRYHGEMHYTVKEGATSLSGR
jgi:prepilin-type N-terminal cleavage/methylation domain-containing protein